MTNKRPVPHRRKREKEKGGDYLRFLEWTMTPRSSRELDEKDLTAFSTKYNVSRTTLYKWAGSDQFANDMKRLNREIAQVRLQDVRNAVYETATLKRDVQAQKLFLQYEEGWVPEEKVEVGGKLEATIKAAAAKIDGESEGGKE